jgi:hypothetical protein
MAFTVNRASYLAVGVKKETTEGTDSVPVGATDDLLCYTNANPGEQTVERIQLQPFGATMTKPHGIMGAQFGEINLEFLFQPSGTAGTSAVNGYASIAALLQAAGCKETLVVGTPNSLVYAPATVTQLGTPSAVSPKCGPCSIYAEHDGLMNQYVGTWGNLVISGSPNTGLVAQFAGRAQYVAPTVATLSGWTGGTNRAAAFRGIGCTITPSGGSAYTGVVKSFKHDFGVAIDNITDCNNSTGLHGILFGDRKPTVEITIAADKDGSAALTYATMYANLAAGTQHAVAWTLGTVSGSKIAFAATQLDLISIRKGVDGHHRTITLQYEVVNSTPEADFSYTLA